MGAQHIFAADLGASGGKCFVSTFAGGGFALREVHRFTHEALPFYLPNRDGAITERLHWDDAGLYREILQGLRLAGRAVGPKLDGIGIDAWGADAQLFSADGELLGRLYCYRDHRLDDMVAQVQARVSAETVYGITGIHFQPFNLSNQLLWLGRQRPELRALGARLLPAPALFAHYLGGRAAVDSTWASVTQLMDAATHTWSRDLLEALDIPPALMPEIVAPGAVLGALHAPLARQLGLDPAPIVATAGHDTACAFAAAPVEHPADALIVSAGTWSLIGKLVPRPITTAAARAANLSNEGGIGNVRLLKNCMGSWLLQELRRGWAAADGQPLAWDTLTAMTAEAPAFGVLINPDDPAFYNPPDMAAAIADFCRRTDQPPPASRAALLRAVHESLALQYRRVREQVDAVAGAVSRVVHIVGGGSRNAWLNQGVADALGLPVLAGPEEATAVGNVMVQAAGVGILPSLTEALPLIRSAFPIRRFEPHPTDAWDRAYARFLALTGGPGA